jgi:hypothetical protein
LYPKLNLSRLKVLRSLQVGGWGTDFKPARHPIIIETFSTIASPLFFELVIVVGTDAEAYLPSEVPFFETLRTMNEVRPFKLVFLVVAPDSFLGEARQELAEALDSVATKGLLNFLNSPPTIRTVRFADDGGTRPFVRNHSRPCHPATSNLAEL